MIVQLSDDEILFLSVQTTLGKPVVFGDDVGKSFLIPTSIL
jgi:hypothetical protein